ncbi:50S ribosomal protein L21e [Candidatus Woesearchaeota archaeon]|nr:50S ribosomal protein L21e [Candidatus Woesearchaeota archaeon]
MTRRIGGLRRKTRYKFRKEIRKRGKLSLTRYMQSFNLGDRVHLALESSIQKGMYHPRFMGKTGVISGKRGRCYSVEINDFGKGKTLIVHPVHLKKA